jgi:glycosyltransferase involved in cell wall biosynthesis
MRGSTGRARLDDPLRPRRILIIVENLPVPFDRRVWSEATTLRQAGYEVSVICPKAANARESYVELEGIHIYRHPMIEARRALGYPLEYAVAHFFEFVLAWWVFYKRGFDVVFCCNPPDTIFLVSGAFKLLFGTRCIFDHHDLNPELYEAKFGRRDFFYRMLCTAERLAFRVADVSIATNESYRKIAIERGGKAPESVFVVRSGPQLERWKILPPKSELKCGRQYLVGYVGVIGRQEGIDLLLAAAKHILAARRDVHFAIAGSGPALEEMKQLAVTLGVAEHVTFIGRVPDAELLAMLNTADVCVNPDRVSEMNDKSTMNKIMEYMALGKPIVQFDMTEGRVSAQDASLYAAANDPTDFGDKIVGLLNDPDRRERMGKFGRARLVEHLAWEHEAPRLLAACDAAFASVVRPQSLERPA